jgi:hypothetical protein
MTDQRPRPVILLLALLAVLAATLWPARKKFGAVLDVYTYQSYAQGALDSPPRLPLEYPPLSLVPFLVPQIIAPGLYLPIFAVLAALAGWAILLTVRRLGADAGLLLLFIVLGAWSTLYYRMDVFVVLVTVLAYWAVRNQCYLLAQVLLGVAVALKLYPLILMPLVVLAQWRQNRRLPWRSVLGGAAAVFLALGPWCGLFPDHARNMLSFHGERPVEIESTGAALAWLLGPVERIQTYGSVNIASPWESTIIAASTVTGFVLLLAVYALVLCGRARDAVGWMLVLLVALATTKVFSAQYLLWVLPFVALAQAETGLEGGADRTLWVTICVLTSLIFPLGFQLPNSTDLLPLVAARSFLWLVVCGLWLARCLSGGRQMQPTETSERTLPVLAES